MPLVRNRDISRRIRWLIYGTIILSALVAMIVMFALTAGRASIRVTALYSFVLAPLTGAGLSLFVLPFTAALRRKSIRAALLVVFGATLIVLLPLALIQAQELGPEGLAVIMVVVADVTAVIVWMVLPDRPAAAPESEESTCPTCGYDLRGCAEPGCPECGWGRSDQDATA